jgi:hypothetical protein
MADSHQKGPSYYKRGTIEVWDFIRDQQLNYHLGNAIKYICRAGFKTEDPLADINKAIHYLKNEREFLRNRSPGIQEVLPFASWLDDEFLGASTEFDR